MGESLEEMRRLLKEVAEHMRTGKKTDQRKAIDKLNRVASLASTVALTLQRQHLK